MSEPDVVPEILYLNPHLCQMECFSARDAIRRLRPEKSTKIISQHSMNSFRLKQGVIQVTFLPWNIRVTNIYKYCKRNRIND